MLEEFIVGVFGVSSDSKLLEMIVFFVKDFFQILLLLFVMIFFIGVLRTYVSKEKIKKKLGKEGFLKYITASGFGVITPFCSCSSIPLFMSFIEAGVPLGVSFSFLATSPLVNEFVIALMLGLFGWKITIMYIIAGMTIGIVSGIVIDKLKLEKYLNSDIVSRSNEKDVKYSKLKQRLLFGFEESKSIVKKLWIFIGIGVLIGALIHNYVPTSFVEGLMSTLGIFGVPLAAIFGIPMYGNGSAILPIAVELFGKGVPLGTALAFMMSIVALSLPEAVILRRIMKPKLIGIFFGIVGVGIVLIGYLFNVLQVLF